MSFVPTLQKNLPMRRRSFFFSAQKLLWLALVLSISLCHQAAFASALSQLAASMQPGQFAELTGMTGFNNGQYFGSRCRCSAVTCRLNMRIKRLESYRKEISICRRSARELQHR